MFIGIVFVVFSSCSTYHIQSNNIDTLEITMQKKSIVKSYGKVVYSDTIKISHIIIYQKIFQMNNGAILTYENALTDTRYKFNNGFKRTLRIIFENYNLTVEAYKDNIYFVKLFNKEKTFYLIAENLNNKRLKLVYGFTRDCFEKIRKKIINEISIEKKRDIYFQDIKKDFQDNIISSWSEKNIIIDSLIQRTGRSRAKILK